MQFFFIANLAINSGVQFKKKANDFKNGNICQSLVELNEKGNVQTKIDNDISTSQVENSDVALNKTNLSSSLDQTKFESGISAYAQKTSSPKRVVLDSMA